MVILALDTTTRPGSAAVMRDGQLVTERLGDASREQAERLPGDLAEILAETAVSLPEVSALAVATGPGSFTGLRIGIATMQGLAMALGVPLIGVSALQALGHAATRSQTGSTRVAAWIDAWRGDVFAASYEGGLEVVPPVVARPEDLLESVRDRSVLFTGDGALAYASVIRAAIGPSVHFTHPVSPALAGAVAALAHEAYLEGHRPPPHAIAPIYVRRPDVELSGPVRPV